MKKIKILIIVIFAVFASFAGGWFVHKTTMSEDSPKYHWAQINSYLDHMDDPKKKGYTEGFSHTSVPFEIRANLEALAEAEELNKLEVLEPSIPFTKETMEKWMAFGEHPDVIFGETPVTSYETGTPLSFTMWYRPAIEEEVSAFIKELLAEARGATQ